MKDALLKAYLTLVNLVSQIPAKYHNTQCFEGSGRKASVRDLLAYQIGWGKRLIDWYQTGLQGIHPEMPGEGFSKWDYTALANHFYSKYQYGSLDQQLEELKQVVEVIVSFVEKEERDGHLDKLGVWQWCTLPSGKQWPLSKWVQVNTVAPYKRLSSQIRKFLREKKYT